MPGSSTPDAVAHDLLTRGGGARARGARRRLGVLGGFAVAVFVLEAAARVMAGPLPEPQRWSTPETQYKVDQIRAHGPAPVAVVGSSVVDVSVYAAELDPDAYNAALGAASIGMVADFTRAVVVPELDPSTVVVGIASRELNANASRQQGIEARFRDAPAAREAFGTESVLDRVDRWLSGISYLVRYRTTLRDPENWIGSAPPSWDGTITADDGLYLGFLDITYHGDESVLAGLRAGALHDFTIGAEQVTTLRRLLIDLRDDGRRVVLLATPVTDDYVDLYPAGRAQHVEFLDLVAALADELGVEFASAGVWDDALMADPLHTNEAGARRLTAMLAGVLAT